jgi:hypothetical protein
LRRGLSGSFGEARRRSVQSLKAASFRGCRADEKKWRFVSLSSLSRFAGLTCPRFAAGLAAADRESIRGSFSMRRHARARKARKVCHPELSFRVRGSRAVSQARRLRASAYCRETPDRVSYKWAKSNQSRLKFNKKKGTMNFRNQGIVPYFSEGCKHRF